jgi:hypothetical protein
MVDQGSIFLHFGKRVHAAINQMTYIRCPPGYFRIQRFKNNAVIFFGAGNRGMRRIRMKAARHALVCGTPGNLVYNIYQRTPALVQVVPPGRFLHCTKNSAGKTLA